MRALTQSQALMTSALLKWCGWGWWSWPCQEALVITAQKWCTDLECAPWPNVAPRYWASNHKNRKRGGRMEMAIKCSQKKTEWVCLSAKEKTDKRMKFTKKFCFFFFCLLDKSQEILLRLFFFLLGSLWFPPSLTSFNWINEQVQPDLRNIYLMHIRCFAGSLNVQVMFELLLILLFHLKSKKNIWVFLKKRKFRENNKKNHD